MAINPDEQSNIADRRLERQRLTGTPLASAHAVVAWMGAVQAQDYGAAGWAIGLRTRGLASPDIDRALDEGSILRTHILRPTWHFVTPEDIGWMLALTAPRVNAACASYYRQLELDDAIFARSTAALQQALHGGRQLTRSELGAALQQAGIETTNLMRLGHLLIRAELDGVICSGGRRGKQFTYALLAARAPALPCVDRDEALSRLLLRYLTSHGPATIADFVWWSGLTAADTRRGLQILGTQLVSETIAGQTYWLAAAARQAATENPSIYLLPNYDEYLVAYADRSAAFDSSSISISQPRANPVFSNTIVSDGRIVGTWKRTLKAREVVVEARLLTPMSDARLETMQAAAERYAAFHGLSLDLRVA